MRVLELQSELRARVHDLEEALRNVKVLEDLLPICCYCKRIRDDQNYWQQVEEYLAVHANAEFSHGVCPDCYQEVLKPQLNRLKQA